MDLIVDLKNLESMPLGNATNTIIINYYDVAI